MIATKEPVEILQYPTDVLSYVSLDGKVYKKHLAAELQIQRYLMGARYEEDEDLGRLDDTDMDVFANIGKFEKKIGISVNEKEVYVINKWIDESEWFNMADFVEKNGGILNIPLFYHTDAPLFIIRHWARIILKIISKVHDVSVILRCLSTKQLWISRDGQKIRLGHTRGIGKVSNLGFINTCPDIYLNLDNNGVNGATENKSSSAPNKTHGPASSSRKTDG